MKAQYQKYFLAKITVKTLQRPFKNIKFEKMWNKTVLPAGLNPPMTKEWICTGYMHGYMHDQI